MNSNNATTKEPPMMQKNICLTLISFFILFGSGLRGQENLGPRENSETYRPGSKTSYAPTFPPRSGEI